MGIPNYFMHIVKEHRKVIKNLGLIKEVDNFYLDSNSIIYDIVNQQLKEYDDKALEPDNFEDIIIGLVCDKIEEYIKIVKPKKNIYITFDGVAPVSKLDQQRQRRYKSNYMNVELLKRKVKWSTTAITPGTMFMTKLNKRINKNFKSKRKYGVKKMIISDSSNEGEGEHKIYEYIRKKPDEHKDGITVIYGLDADLIMLSLNHLNVCSEIYLFRETPHFIQTVDKTLMPNANYMIDIGLFGTILSKDVGNKNDRCDDFIIDYVFLCFFLGNDFLPHFPTLNIRTDGISLLLDAYKKVIVRNNLKLINERRIVWKNLRKLLEYLSNDELNTFKSEYMMRDMMSEKIIKRIENEEDIINSIPILERDLEEYIDPWEIGWEKRYYNKLLDINNDETLIKNVCINYLEGLEWTLEYYTNGCKNWRWAYKYDYGPLLSDLTRYVPYFNMDLIKENHDKISSMVQLCYVLPRDSLQLLPAIIEDKVKDEDWYKKDNEYVWAFCRYLWEAHVRLPEININELEKKINPLIKSLINKT